MTSESTAPETLFDLALYLVCSARLALDENLGLASFRLTEAASRLIAAAADLGVDAGDFLQREKGVLDVEKMKVMHDLPGYTAALDEIQARFVAETKRRNAAAPA